MIETFEQFYVEFADPMEGPIVYLVIGETNGGNLWRARKISDMGDYSIAKHLCTPIKYADLREDGRS